MAAAGSSWIGARASTRGSYQPLPSAYRMVTMWSVKIRPNPGLTREASRSASGTGAGFGRISKSRMSPPLMERDLLSQLWEVSTNLPRTVVKLRPRGTDRDGSGGRATGDAVPDLGGSQQRARRPGRDLGRDRLGYSPGGVIVPEVLEQQ